MFAHAEAVVEEEDAASAVAEGCEAAVDWVWVEGEATALPVAVVIAAAGSVAASIARLPCLDRLDFHRRSTDRVAADLPTGLRACVRLMAICLHQPFDPARDLAGGGAERESQHCRAALGQAQEFGQGPDFDRAEAHFQPVARNLRLPTFRIS
jgi:hypothetical protein